MDTYTNLKALTNSMLLAIHSNVFHHTQVVTGLRQKTFMYHNEVEPIIKELKIGSYVYIDFFLGTIARAGIDPKSYHVLIRLTADSYAIVPFTK